VQNKQRRPRPMDSGGPGRSGPRPISGRGNASHQQWLQEAPSTSTHSESVDQEHFSASDTQWASGATSSAATSAPQSRPRQALYTTGGDRVGSDVRTELLPADGSWSSADFLGHHSDRSNSWAANKIRNEQNQDLQAYDFTLEALNDQGQPIAGSAQGLELITPQDARVIDLQTRYAGSGGLGCFVVLEYLENGKRVSVHHMDSVAELSKGQIISGGTVIGTQGASGTEKFDYATHIDIIGTIEAVEAFVRANQSGEFKKNIEPEPTG
jgi:hypothetical protein